MKTIGILLLVLLAGGISRDAVVAAQAEINAPNRCGNHPIASPASEEDEAAFQGILDALNVDLVIHLYVSHDPAMKNFGGAMSSRCEVGNADKYEIHETDENWTIYDPDLIQGDLARDFVFAHEIAHHLNGDTSAGIPKGKLLELRADFSGAKYLLRMHWNEAMLLHALDLLNLSQNPPPGYPTAEERKTNIEDATKPLGPAPPTDLQATLAFEPDSGYKGSLDELVRVNFSGPIRLQPAGTNDKYVCAEGTPDPKIPSTRHFAFYDRCSRGERTSFVLRLSSAGNFGYWIMQTEEPCPGYAANCRYALESVGDQLQFWNQDLAADQYGWERELGDHEVFTFEAADLSEGLVLIKARSGGYIVVDPKTSKLQGGGTQKQAAEFRVLFEPE
jgi:hypothetical protein